MGRGRDYPREMWQAMGRKGGAKSTGRTYAGKEWQRMGREGGKVSGMVRREPLEQAVEKYEAIARTEGFRAAIARCIQQSWHNGYYARQRGEAKRARAEQAS